jgi:hypothetical protein
VTTKAIIISGKVVELSSLRVGYHNRNRVLIEYLVGLR